MLDAKIKEQLKGYMEKLQQPIELVAAYDDSNKSQELKQLLDEIEPMSAKISLRTVSASSRSWTGFRSTTNPCSSPRRRSSSSSEMPVRTTTGSSGRSSTSRRVLSRGPAGPCAQPVSRYARQATQPVPATATPIVIPATTSKLVVSIHRTIAWP
jgi:hypothetical protein